MRATAAAIDRYVRQTAELLERYGVLLSSPANGATIEIVEAPSGALSWELRGELPDGDALFRAAVAIREEFRPVGGGWYERSRYEYELVDRARDLRRAFHLHVPEWFERTHLVVVHEHCERPIGTIRCPHYEGSPVRDSFEGIARLMDAWTADPIDCADLRCLEAA